MYLNTTDSIVFLPSRAIKGLDVVTIELEESPDSFDVIAAWHPRYNDDPLQKWLVSLLD